MPPRRELLERLLEKVEFREHNGWDCWIYTGGLSKAGYGLIGTGIPKPKTDYTHRIAYRTAVGPIPEGLELDHLCRNPACLNPDHLDPVTHIENCHRGHAVAPPWPLKSHCKHGHEFTPENTRHCTRNGKTLRECIQCRRDIANRHYHRQNPGARRYHIRQDQ